MSEMMNDSDDLERSVYLLRFGADEERAQAIKHIGEAAYAPAIPHLIDLVREADPGTRYLAAMALSKLGDEAESAVAVLLLALRDDDMYLRVAVTSALIAIGAPSVPGLVRALFDQKAAVRRASAKALGKIGSERALSPLRVALHDSDQGVRQFVAEAIARIEQRAS